MSCLVIGPIQLEVELPAAPLAEELRSHIQRVAGSRGEVVDWVEQRWGAITLSPEIRSPDAVVLLVRGPTGSMVSIHGQGLPPGSSDEVALGYVLGRLLCRGFITADAIGSAPALPNGRYLTDLRGVEIATMPQALHEALEELHVIGFTGVPLDPPGVPLWIENGPVLATHEASAEDLQAEIHELLARMAEKFLISQRGPTRYGQVSLRVEIVPTETLPDLGVQDALPALPSPRTVRLSSRNWARGHPDLPLLQWILIHLMRPRRRHVFLPMRPLLIVPRTIPPARVLPSGDHLADLPAVRHQLMPAKIAQLLDDLHRRGGDPLTVLERRSGNGRDSTVELRFGPLRFPTTRSDRAELMNEASGSIAPLAELFRSEGGGEAKYGAVTLQIQPREETILDFVSDRFLPGCPDEILCEFLVATWLRNGTIPLTAVQGARRIGRRTVVAAPTIQRQLTPSGTVDLIEAIHTGRTGPDRRTSGWKYRAE